MITQRSIDILLIEDNPNDIELTIRALKKNKMDFKLHICRNGEEALDFLFCRNKFADRNIKDQPGMILLDLKMPKVSGMEVIEKIKMNKNTKRIPVVVLTTSREDNDIVKSYDLGINSYIVKPVDFGRFVNAVAEIGQYWLKLNELTN